MQKLSFFFFRTWCVSWLYVYICYNRAPFLNVMCEATGPGVCAAPVFDNQVDKSILVTTPAEIPQDNVRQAYATLQGCV